MKTVTINGIEYDDKVIEALNATNSMYEEYTLEPSAIVIAKQCFYNNQNVKHINLSNIKYIENNAFERCLKLEEIKLPENLEYLGAYSFESCHNLKKVIFNNNLEEINTFTFVNCLSLKDVIIPEGIKKINSFAFLMCNSLEKIVLPQSIEFLDEAIFSGCENLKKIVINASCEIPESLISSPNIENIYITKKSFNKSPDFVSRYKDIIEIVDESLDELLNKGKSFSEINKMIKNNEIIL